MVISDYKKTTEFTKYFPLFHPYPSDGETTALDVSYEAEYNNDVFVCGVLRDDYETTFENRKRAPPTKVAGAPYRYDGNDVYVDGSTCVPYPCPLLIKIQSPEFQSSSLNGYYVLNYPPSFQGKRFAF